MPLELFYIFKKCTSAVPVHEADDVAIPAEFVDIGVDNVPASEKLFVIMKWQTICLIISGGIQ